MINRQGGKIKTIQAKRTMVRVAIRGESAIENGEIGVNWKRAQRNVEKDGDEENKRNEYKLSRRD